MKKKLDIGSISKKVIRRLLPKYQRTYRIIGGPIRGMKIVTSIHDYPAAILGYSEKPLLDWFTKNIQQGETWLDIGAHYGYTAIALCNLVGSSGKVYAFEPMFKTVGCLSQTRQANHFSQMTVVPFALDDSRNMSKEISPVVRGMVDRTLSHTGSVLMESFFQCSLDWLWPQIDGGKIDGIKIDVQGMEIMVLRGMKEILKKNQPKLVVEIHKRVDREEFLSMISESGYSIYAYPIEPGEDKEDPLYLDDHSYYFPLKGK
jgi:FkbM family methyltransferase